MVKCEVKAKVIDMLNNLFPNSGVDADILEYVDLIDDLGMDSITFISIVVEVESMFDITVSDENLSMEKFKNVHEIIGVVENAMKCNVIVATEQEVSQ